MLRDGFALTAVDATDAFADIAAESLRVSLHGLPLDRVVAEAVAHIMDGFARLAVHADVPDGIRALRGRAIGLVTLSNGSAAVAEALFDRAGIGDHFERLLTVDDAGRWKPAPRRTRTRCSSVVSTRRTRCSWRFILGTSTGRLVRASPPRGSTGPVAPTRSTSGHPTSE